MAYRIAPAGKLYAHMGEDLVITATLRDRSNTVVNLTGAGVNITFFPYGSGSDLLTAPVDVVAASSGIVGVTIPAATIWEKLQPGLYQYQIKVAQGSTVLVADSGTLTLVNGSLGPDPTIPVALVITGDAPNGTVGVAYTPYSYTIEGGVPPYTVSLPPGQFGPDGLTLDSEGEWTGTPTTEETQEFVLLVTDSVGNTATHPDTIAITAASCQWVPIAESEIGFEFVPFTENVEMSGSTITATAEGLSGSSWTMTTGAAVEFRITVSDYISPQDLGEDPSFFDFGSATETVTNAITGPATAFDPNPVTSTEAYDAAAYSSGSGGETSRPESYSMLVEVLICDEPPIEA